MVWNLLKFLDILDLNFINFICLIYTKIKETQNQNGGINELIKIAGEFLMKLLNFAIEWNDYSLSSEIKINKK